MIFVRFFFGGSVIGSLSLLASVAVLLLCSGLS